MCLFSPSSKEKLKATFTTPRSATGFVVRSASPPPRRQREPEMLYQQQSSQYRTRRPSAWTDPERGVREWKADIERLERDARIADQRTAARGSTSATLVGQGGRGIGRRGTGRTSAEGSTLGGNAESVALS